MAVSALDFKSIMDQANAEINIDVDSMPTTFKRFGSYNHPKLAGRDVTLAAANKGAFVYAWLDDEHLGMAAHDGYRKLSRDCKAAVAGGETLDETAWNGGKFVRKGNMWYCFCLQAYADAVKQSGHDVCAQLTKAHAKTDSTTEGGGMTGQRIAIGETEDDGTMPNIKPPDLLSDKKSKK